MPKTASVDPSNGNHTRFQRMLHCTVCSFTIPDPMAGLVQEAGVGTFTRAIRCPSFFDTEGGCVTEAARKAEGKAEEQSEGEGETSADASGRKRAPWREGAQRPLA